MKKTALFAAAAALMAASPAMANGGYVGAHYSTGEVDQGASTDVESIRGEGEFGWNGGAGSFSGQFGGQLGNIDVATSTDTDFYTLNGHLYYEGGSWRVGGVVTYGNIDEANLDEWTYGAEAGFDFGPNTTLNVSAVLGTIDSGGSELDTWQIDGSINQYFGDNFRLTGVLGFGAVDDADFDLFNYGVNAEWQFGSVPISLVGGLNAFAVDTGFGDVDANYLTIGARWNFGGATLRERNASTPFHANGLYGARLLGVASHN